MKRSRGKGYPAKSEGESIKDAKGDREKQMGERDKYKPLAVIHSAFVQLSPTTHPPAP